MIYRFTQVIELPEGQKLQIGDPIILDNPDSTDPIAKCVKDAIAKGLLDEGEVKTPKAAKQKTQ